MSKHGQWVATADRNSWESARAWSTREEAIEGAPRELFLEPGASFWVGRAERVTSWCVTDRINASPLVSTAIELVNVALHQVESFGIPAAIDPEDSDRASLEMRLVAAVRGWIEGRAMIPGDAWQAVDVTRHMTP